MLSCRKDTFFTKWLYNATGTRRKVTTSHRVGADCDAAAAEEGGESRKQYTCRYIPDPIQLVKSLKRQEVCVITIYDNKFVNIHL